MVQTGKDPKTFNKRFFIGSTQLCFNAPCSTRSQVGSEFDWDWSHACFDPPSEHEAWEHPPEYVRLCTTQTCWWFLTWLVVQITFLRVDRNKNSILNGTTVCKSDGQQVTAVSMAVSLCLCVVLTAPFPSRSVSSWSCQDSSVSPGLEASQPGRNTPQPNRLRLVLKPWRCL